MPVMLCGRQTPPTRQLVRFLNNV